MPYTLHLAASGGRGGYTWSLVSGSLPLGLTMSVDGLISGTPTKTSTFTFIVRVTSAGVSVNKTLSISVTAPVLITTNTLADGTVGSSYSASLAASGGTKTFIWALEAGSLPPGLSITGSKITGTQQARGSYSFTMRVTDTAGRTNTKTLVINVYQLPITTAALPNPTKGAYYSFQMTADGGKGTYSWKRSSGSFPSGVTINSAGLIYGTPSVTGAFTVIIKVSDQGGRSTTRTFAIVVN